MPERLGTCARSLTPLPSPLQCGCLVVNAPTANTVAAAEHGIALLASVARNVAQADASMKAGKWDRSTYVGVSMVGKTLAVMGFGKVGLRAVLYFVGWEHFLAFSFTLWVGRVGAASLCRCGCPGLGQEVTGVLGRGGTCCPGLPLRLVVFWELRNEPVWQGFLVCALVAAVPSSPGNSAGRLRMCFALQLPLPT